MLATERLAPMINTQKSSGVAPKEVHLNAKSRVQKDMRAELLGESNANTGKKCFPLQHKDIITLPPIKPIIVF